MLQSETRDAAVEKVSEQAGQSAAQPPVIFESEIERLLALAEAALAGKRLGENSHPPQKDSEARKTKGAPEPDERSEPPALCIVRGGSGAGKTTVLERLAAGLSVKSFFLRCHEGWTDPLHVFHDLVAALRASRQGVERVLERYAWGLGPVYPAGGKDAPAEPVWKPTFFAALAGFLTDLAREEPFAILIDDLNCGDPLVPEFLGFLGRALRKTYTAAFARRNDAVQSEMPRLLAVVSASPLDDGDDPHVRAFAGLLEERFVTVMDLPEADRARCQRLLSASPWRKLSNGNLTRFLALSHGNPLRCRVLLRLCEAAPTEAGADGAVARAEQLAADGIVRALVLRLSPALRDLVSVLALFRRPATEDLLGRIMERQGLERLLSEAQQRELVRGSPEGWFLANHELATVAHQILTPSERALWHDRIAASLAADGPRDRPDLPYALCQHLVSGGDPHAAIEPGLRAAEFLTRSFAFQRALVVLYNLLGILRTAPPCGATPAEVTRKIIDIEERIGRVEAAKRNLKMLLFEPGDPSLGDEMKAELYVRLARVYMAAGRHSKALRMATRGFAKKLPERSLARLWEAIAAIHLDRNDSKKALNYCLRGLSCAKGDDAAMERADLRQLLARIYRARGTYGLAIESLLQALETVERAAGENAARPILDELGALYLAQGNYFRAARYLYRSLDAKRAVHDFPGMAASYAALGEVYSRSGNFTKALEEQRKAAEAHELLGDWGGLGRDLIDAGDAYRSLGDIGDAIACYRSAIDVAEKSGRTEDLVSAFMALAETYFFLGDIRQAEAYLRQVQILAQEFKLRVFEARSEQLAGAIATFHREWDDAAKHLQKACDLFAGLGMKCEETDAKLDLAYTYYDRELFDEALKTAGKAQASADELRAPLLQARALQIKGFVYRLSETGVPGKWREYLDRALQIARSVADVRLHFEILYSLGKAYHFEQSHEEAESWYRKAGDILDRVAASLSEDEAVRFWTDKRRKLFKEDYERLRREFGARASSPAGREKASDGWSETIDAAAYQDLLSKVGHLAAATTHANFYVQLLGLGLDLVKADRGFLVEATATGWQYVAYRGLRPETLTGRLSYAETLVNEALRRRTVFITTGREEEEKFGSRAALAEFKDREAVLLPIMHGTEVMGVLYGDQTIEGDGGFPPWTREILEQFQFHAGAAWRNRRTFLAATTWPGTPFLVEPYFTQVVREAQAQEARGGKPFALLGIRLPFPLGDLAPHHARNIQYVIGRDNPAGVLGDSIVVALLRADATPKETEASVSSLLASMRKLLPVKQHLLYRPEDPAGNPRELLQHLKHVLNPSAELADEIQDLAGCEVSLRDAKQILEKHIIMRTLRHAKGNITRAAELLGIHRPQLSQLIRKHELRKEAFL
ncbi:MAG TPA: hypothetical protein DCM87_04865 [Planctomycetes bacterium]|nr:hypothetical protein [Planctomycetota bacterium]